MRKLLVILVLLAAGSVAYASPARLVDIELNHDKGLAIATIHVDGAIRFVHETVEAKEGKPFRVLVDILQAEHHLPTKDFASLPECIIAQIRTSQYSVTPEKVVRIVFDLDAETVYRADSDSKTIKLYFTDKSAHRFNRWLASAAFPLKEKSSGESTYRAKVAAAGSTRTAESVARINKSIESDRQLSLVDKSSGKKKDQVQQEKPKATAKATPSKKPRTEIKTSKEPLGPEFDPTWLASLETEKQKIKDEPQVKPAPVAETKTEKISKATVPTGTKADVAVKKAVPHKAASPPPATAKAVAASPSRETSKKVVASRKTSESKPVATVAVKEPQAAKKRS